MPTISAKVCQPVPARATEGRPSRLRRASGVCLVLLAASACDQEELRSPSKQLPREHAWPPEAPRLAPQPRPPEQERPPMCPAIGCEPESFEVLLERSSAWAPGTYYIRASVDGGPRRVCSVVFEAVLGAAHDTCSGGEMPFRVHYRYDELEQSISSISFGQVHAVQLSVLTSELAPPLVEADHQFLHQYSSSTGGCGPCPSGPLPLTVRVVEQAQPSDAGSGDAGSGDAGGGTPDGGQVDAAADAAL